MPQVHFYPDDKIIEVKPGTNLLQAGSKARVNIRNRCGGKAGCLMCKVIVHDQSGLTPMKHNEQLKLGELKDKGFRLACQANVIGYTIVHVPEDPLKAAVRAQLAKQKEEEGYEI